MKKCIFIITALVLSICSVSCGNEDEERYATMNLSNTYFDSDGGSGTILISSNSSWELSTYSSWISISPSNGTNDGSAYLSVAPNNTGSQRTGYISLRYYDSDAGYYVTASNEITIVQAGGSGGSGSGGSDVLPTPSGVYAQKNGSYVTLSWNTVSNATKYAVYRSRTASGSFSLMTQTSNTSYTDYSPIDGVNYYKVKAMNSSTESDFSSIASVDMSSSSGGSGNQESVPNAPTGVTVSNEGNNYIPDVRVRWNSVDGATKYYVYKSSSANGTYSKIGETTYTAYGDSNAPTNGASAYYKVKAVNSAGSSGFSSYAKYTSTSNDEAFEPAYKYGNCTVSGNTITLRWTHSTGYGYGKATEVVLRVWNPFAEEWQDTKLSTSATYTSFNFSTKIDSNGYVKAGIVVSNSNGSFTAGAKIYDANAKKWLN